MGFRDLDEDDSVFMVMPRHCGRTHAKTECDRFKVLWLESMLREHNSSDRLEIDRVIFNDPATIVFWKDGTKTVVKAQDEKFDPEKGLAMAISRKALGNKSNYYDVISKWVDDYEASKVRAMFANIDEMHEYEDYKLREVLEAAKTCMKSRKKTARKLQSPL